MKTYQQIVDKFPQFKLLNTSLHQAQSIKFEILHISSGDNFYLTVSDYWLDLEYILNNFLQEKIVELRDRKINDTLE